MLKLPKRFHPDFSNPKIKPKGPVEIDRENPLSDGLVAYHLFNTLGSDVIDLAGTRNLKIVNAVHKDDYYGRSLDYSPSVSYAHASTKVFNDYPFTVIARVDLRNISTSEQVIVCNTRIAVPAEWGFVIQLHPNGMAGKLFPRVVVRNTSFYPITGTTDVIASPGIYSIALVANSATDRKLYVNGVLDGSDTLSSPFLTSADTLQTGYLARYSSLTAASPFEGKILNIAYYAKALSGSDIYQLNSYPYSILKPANDFYYFTGAAAGGYTLTAEAGVFSLGSDPVNLTYSEILTAEAGVYSLGSDPVTLTYTPAGSYTLTADAGVFSLGSDPVNLLLSEVLVADPGVYLLGSDAVNLTYTPVSTLSAEPGVFTLGSDAINLTYAEILTAEAGVYTLGSSAVNLVLGILETPNCYTWLTSTITDVEWYSSLIDASPTYVISTINGDPTYVVSTIDGDDLYLIGDLC